MSKARKPRTPSANPRGAVSIEDVAAAAKVSTATVSRVVNGVGKVAPATAARVRAAIDQLGYQPNSFAQGLGSGKSRVIGLALPRFHGEFMSFLLAGADEEATTLGYHLLMTTIVSGVDGRRRTRVVGSRLVDAMILVVTNTDDPLAADAKQAGVPVVVVDTDFSHIGLDSVVLDNEKGTREAVEHLLRWTEPPSLFFVGGPRENYDTQQRAAAFGAALRDVGWKVTSEQIAFADYSLDWGKEWALRALQRGTLPRPNDPNAPAGGVAIVAANDKIACGILHIAQENGLKVPEQLRVVGFNDSLIAQIIQPSLSTVSLPMAELGATAVRMLVRRLQNPDAEPLCRKLPTSLVIRESSTARRF